MVEEWKWRGGPVWSHAGIYAVANAHKDKVKLMFSHGAELPDPKKLFDAGLGGNKWRAIDLREGDQLDEDAFKALLREAVAYNSNQSTPKKKGPAADEKPKLLSGGNPQIAKADGDATVQAYITAMPDWKRDVGQRLDALIVRNVPGVRKAVRWNSPFYGVEGQGWFISFHCFTKHVKVTLLCGSSLRPLPPVESKDEDTRYFHIYEDGQLDEELVGSWIRQAAALPG